MQQNRQIITTKDGSKTIYFPDIDENYHSQHGALQESNHVFVKNGLENFQNQAEITVFEVGFGTGLNACLAFEFAVQYKKTIHYDTIEAFPIALDEVTALDYASLFSNERTKALTVELHTITWNEKTTFDTVFNFTKLQQELKDITLQNNHYDCIFFDAFAPNIQPELWTIDVFEKLFNALKPNGLLVTYCAKGQVKRNLKSVGFTVECVAGPPGKREMTLAWKR